MRCGLSPRRVWKMSAWLWAGSGETIRVRKPWQARSSAVRAAVVDLPTPPLPKHRGQFAFHQGHQVQRHLHGRRRYADERPQHQEAEDVLQFFQFVLQRLRGLAACHLLPGGADGRQVFPQAIEYRSQVHPGLPQFPHSRRPEQALFVAQFAGGRVMVVDCVQRRQHAAGRTCR